MKVSNMKQEIIEALDRGDTVYWGTTWQKVLREDGMLYLYNVMNDSRKPLLNEAGHITLMESRFFIL